VPLFNAREGYGAYIVPGVAVLIIQQTLLIAITMLFGTWRERGGLPVARSAAAYFGMLLAFASVAFGNSLYFYGFVMWWQDYPRAGNFGGLLYFSALFALCVAALGMLLGSLFRTRERSTQLLLCAALPCLFLSGLSWPVEAMPGALQAARWLIPSTSGIQGFVALNQLGASVHEIAPEVLALCALLALSLAAGLWRWCGRADFSPGDPTTKAVET
jgi:ABC-2 type transport system permease protein